MHFYIMFDIVVYARKKPPVGGFYFEIKSLITSPAIISPATDGTKEVLPGIRLNSLSVSVFMGISSE